MSATSNRDRKLATVLYGTLPLLALVMPAAAHAATATNTATLTLPPGVTDTDLTNNTATDSDNVLAALVAVNDTVGGISAATGGTNVLNVFTGDTVNGAPATSTNAILAVAAGSSVPAGLTFDTATGNISVAAGTQPGTYSFNYTLCEAANPTNCKTATATVTVIAVIAPVTETGSGTSGTAATVIANVRSNDFVNGAAATAANSTIATSGTWPAGITLDTTTGAVSIAASVQPGSYAIAYTLCDRNTPANCQTVTDTVTVAASILPVTETGSGTSGTAATVIANVRSNDTVNGVAATAANSTIATSGTWTAGITLDTTTGAVNIAASVQPGTYSLAYTLCDRNTPANCQTVTDTVTVAANIAPVTETGSGTSGTASTVIANVRSNDFVNGVAATAANSTIATSGTWPAGITLDTTTGAVSIAASVQPGTYSVAYTLCDLNTPANCQTVTDTVTVSANIAPVTESGSGTSGTAATVIANVRSNDFVNGVAATAANSTIATSGTWTAGITLDTTTGAISIAASVQPGTYSVAYTLCDLNTPANCQTVTDTVTVAANIVPVTENGTGLAFTASTPITNVRTNDTVNGAPATSANSTLSVDPAHPLPAGFTFDVATGAFNMDNTVAAGTYDVWYQLCDKNTPANCATVKDTVVVSNRRADLVVTKTNGVTSVTSGQTTTYTVTVTNNGPDSVTGVVLKDSPGTGLTCPATNPLSFSGSGIPAGSFTVQDITGTGITLGTLANGQSITVTYTCTVN